MATHQLFGPRASADFLVGALGANLGRVGPGSSPLEGKAQPLSSPSLSPRSELSFVKKRCLEAFVSGTITLNMITIQTSVQTQKRFT